MKTGVSSYSFKKYVEETKCDAFKVCSLAKEIGFDGIEFVNLDMFFKCDDIKAFANEIREYCEKIGIEIIAYTVGADFLRDDIEDEVKRLCACIDVAKALGAPVLRHDVCYKMPDERPCTYRDIIKRIAPYIKKVTQYAKENGIKTCTENHGRIFQAPERVEELILEVGSDNYGWLCDIGNFLCVDVSPVTAVPVAVPYIFHVHVKDFLFKPGSEDKPEGFFDTLGGNYLRGTVLGHGIVPVKNCVSVLKAGGYDGYLSLEFEGMEETLFALRSGYNYLKKIIDKV